MIRETGSKGREYWRKPMWLPILLIAGAVIMFAAAIATNKDEGVKQYIPLNEAVEQALLQLDNNTAEANEHKLTDPAAALQHSQVLLPQSEEEVVKNEDTISDKDDTRIDINRASLSELQGLKGIGPSKANAIILEREKNGFFRTPDDLLRVKGIGNKLLLEIKESIVARP